MRKTFAFRRRHQYLVTGITSDNMYFSAMINSNTMNPGQLKLEMWDELVKHYNCDTIIINNIQRLI